MFAPLHVKSDYSLGYGTASVDELVERAAALGYTSLALTDLENLYGQVRFHDRCRQHGIHPITGIELRPGFDGRNSPGTRAGRLVLLALDESGYRSLCRIVSCRRGAVLKGGKGAEGGKGTATCGASTLGGEQCGPSGDPLPLAMRHAEGLFALSDDPVVIERLAAEGSFAPDRLGLFLVRPAASEPPPPVESEKQLAKASPPLPGEGQGLAAEALAKAGGDWADSRTQLCTETNLLQAAQRLGVRLVADLDSVFLDRADHALHVLQLAISQGRLLRETAQSTDVESPARWLRSPADAAALFADVPGALSAAAEIAQLCRFVLGAGEETRHVFNPAAMGRDAAALRRLCDEALVGSRQKGRGLSPEYRSRLDQELAVFDALGFSGFMLTVADILTHCRQKGILVAVRGSAVSSLVLHLLGGSPVDPIAHGLVFERFLHAGKSAWPDVDIDLPWHRRDEVIQWVYERFGEDKVAMVAALHTFRYRSALREGLKAWGAPESVIEAMARAIPPEDLAVDEVDFLGVAGAPAASEVTADIASHRNAKMSGLEEILPLIRRLVGRPRHIAVHPGGIVVDWRPLRDLLPLELAPKGVVITQYDLVAVAKLGLVKIDLLGNRCLSEIEEGLALAGWPRPLTLDSIPTEDRATLQLIDRAQTVGCFQLESPAMRSLLARLPVRRQSDLIAALALIRPGAASGEVKSTFVRRARGEEPVELPFSLLADWLGETYGLPIYEEDIMLLLSRTGGVTLAQADELRRGIVKSGGSPVALASLQQGFLRRAEKKFSNDQAAVARGRRAWSIAARFAAYSFNKAHAASYALLSYYSAYLKTHHPVEFACALLNHHQGLYPLRTEAAELTRLGVKLLGPHVNWSQYDSQCVDCVASTTPPSPRGRGSGGGGRCHLHCRSQLHPPPGPLPPSRTVALRRAGPSREGGQQQRLSSVRPGEEAGGKPLAGRNEAVRVGLDKVKGLSRRAALALVAERDSGGPFGTLGDLLDRVKLASNEVRALVLCGACDGLAPLDADEYPFAHEAELERLQQQKADQLELEGISQQGGPRPGAAATAGAGEARLKLYQALVRAKNELAYLEMHLSAHPMALLRHEAGRYRCLSISRAIEEAADAPVRLAAIIGAMRRVPTRQGPMQFITLEDETGLLEAVVFPAVYKRLGERVTTPGPFLVEGIVRKEQGAVHLEVSRLGPFHEREGAYGR